MTIDASLVTKAHFVTRLAMTEQTDDVGRVLTNRMGRPLYMLDRALIYVSMIANDVIVPEGFVTDLSSIPRLPGIYLMLNGYSDVAGVVHDYLYSMGRVPRETADQVLREACLAIGVPAWKTALIYAGVRAFGGSHYGASS